MKVFLPTLFCLNLMFCLLQAQSVVSSKKASVKNLKEGRVCPTKELKNGQIEYDMEMYWKEKEQQGVFTKKDVSKIKEGEIEYFEEKNLKKEDLPATFVVVKKILNATEVEATNASADEYDGDEGQAKRAALESTNVENVNFLGVKPLLNVPLEIFKIKFKVRYKEEGKEVREVHYKAVTPTPVKTNLSYYNRCKSRRLRMG